MARYIDADKFKNRLETAMEKMHLIGGVKAVDLGAVIQALDRQKTADVAPKSEVAREIFEEIEKAANVRYWKGLTLKVFEVDAESFAKLKKKYIGENNDGTEKHKQSRT